METVDGPLVSRECQSMFLGHIDSRGQKLHCGERALHTARPWLIKR
jgi:hypothetical protein